MRHKIISISHAKSKLLELSRKMNEEGQAYLLTKDGEAVGALVPIEDYEALLESFDILADQTTLAALEQAKKNEASGLLWKRDKAGKWIKLKRSKKSA